MIRATPSPPCAAQSETAPGDRAVGYWLLGVCAMIVAMAVIGAITRLTESGLSIMEWAPVKGVLPPLTEDEWARLFALYQQTAEYQRVHAWMDLGDFKTIFWWEWLHRVWGRLIGLVFAGGFLWFLLRRRLHRGIWPHLAGLFALGALQAVIGWIMVASGFGDRTDVSQYRLTLHLGMALAIYAYALWLVIRLVAPPPPPDASAGRLRKGLIAFGGLLAVTLLAGALVAGTNAGLVHNTFPLMGGQLVPPGYLRHEPVWLNAFETPSAAQFNHRFLAILTVLAAFGLWLWARRLPLTQAAQRAFTYLALGAAAQVALGVWTLLAVVPVWLGALHQLGAIVVLTLTIWALTRLRT